MSAIRRTARPLPGCCAGRCASGCAVHGASSCAARHASSCAVRYASSCAVRHASSCAVRYASRWPDPDAGRCVGRFLAALVLNLITTFGIAFGIAFGQVEGQAAPLKIFISVDMEGIGGIGTGQMTRSSGGKDYATGRELMTAEVNAVVETILGLHGDAEILVNDSHGDMQNLLHTRLDPRVEYIQGNIKPLGMVQGLDESYDGAIFLGYHARAGNGAGFLAHTGTGSVKGLWLNDTEVGEGGLNAAFAGAIGVPILMVAGDQAFTEEFKALVDAEVVATKVAVTPLVARLVHPEVVRARLRKGTERALRGPDHPDPMDVGSPVRVRMRFATTTRADILQAIPGMKRVDGYSVAYNAASMDEAYRLIRLMYKYVSF